jgi:CTP synthase
VAGILVPGGFGERGIEGKILAAGHARRMGLPYFGICLGMQVAVISFAREVLGLTRANSTEFDPSTPHPVIDLLPEQGRVVAKGGTMRLGAYPAVLAPGSRARALYGEEVVHERHRHRFEFNPEYLEDFESHGMLASGRSPDGKLVEIVELQDHPWYVGVQFHPEFTSRPLRPHPLFQGFLTACLSYSS